MANAGASIEAILTLDNSGFTTGLDKSIQSLTKFANDVKTFNGSVSTLTNLLNDLSKVLSTNKSNLTAINDAVAGMKDFNSFATAINKTANALKVLSDNSMNAEQGINIMNNVFKAWRDTLNGTEVKVKGVISSIEQINNPTRQASTSLKEMQNDLLNVARSFRIYGEGVHTLSQADAEAKAQTQMLRKEYGLSGQKLVEVRNQLNQVTNATRMYSQALSQPRVATEQFSTAVNLEKMSLVNLETVLEKGRMLHLTNAEMMERYTATIMQNSEVMQQNAVAQLRAMGYTGKLSAETEKSAQSMQKQSSATNQAKASQDAMTSSTNRLKSALQSLKMVGTLVASMMVWNFASSLINATRETVNAKSEMEGYFKMLNFSQKDINQFNSALDKTVQQFQRVNKYSMGETISSIGVEFNLTTKEMEKAMKVTAMVTSEYLRAGRNANEASLAVKDVLQGQFQRLSRETGVKGEQLKEAGWSGDNQDVLSLMEALEKVGESRNWDVFASKANSLNDMVLILQNRFGEWSADMVYAVQPAIVGAFNMIMGTAEKFGSIMSKVWEWISSDGIAQNIIQWTGLATAIGGVVSALIVYRTGANLTQIVQMGLTRTIASTILGLNAETVAEYGLRTAIISNIANVEAQTVAEQGRLTTIVASITGLKAEEVAQIGSTKALISSLLALDMEIVKRQGVMVALASRIGISPSLLAIYGAETEAELTTAQASILLTASLTPLIAVVGTLVVVFGSMALAMNESAEQMKKFNELCRNGNDIIKSNRQTVQSYTDKQEALKKKLGETTKGTKEYLRVQAQLRETNRDLVTANYELENSIKAVEIAHSSQKHFEEARVDQSIKMQGQLADAYIKAGYSQTEAYEMANDSLQEALDGANQLREALQRLALANTRRVQGNEYLLDMFGENNVDKETAEQQIKKFNDYQVMIESGLEKGLTDESFFGRLDGWLTHYQGQLGVFWTNLESSIISGDFEAFFDNLGKGWEHFVDTWTPQSKISDWIGKIIGIDPKDDGQIDWGRISNLGEWILDKLPIFNWILNFEEIKAQLLESAITKISEFWNDLSTNVMECIQNITTYDYIGEFLNTWGLDNFDFGTWVNEKIGLPLGTAFYNTIMSIPLVSDILQLFGLVNGDNTGASEKGAMIGRAIQNALTTIIQQIPIVGTILNLLGLITGTYADARSKGHGVGDSIKQGLKAGVEGLAKIVTDEIDRIKKYLEDKAGEVYNSALNFGKNVVNGAKSGMDSNSPGILAREVFPNEFGTYIPNAISDSIDTAYSTAQSYGQAIVDGVSSAQGNQLGLDGMVSEYQSDAQTVSMYSQMMGTETTTAFDEMNLAVNNTTATMSANVSSSYSTMQQKQSSLLQNMKTQNTTAYNEMYTKSNQSLLQMRDSTTNITNQMIHAWDHMKVQLVATADALRNESTNHFNQLSSTIGSFYRKIQNPSNWGSAGSSNLKQGTPNRRVGRRVASSLKPNGYSGGGSRWTGKSTMTIGALKSKICPNGQCGDLFDGYKSSDVVDVGTFLSMVQGEHGFGWNSWNGTHYNYIKNKSDQWNMKSPVIDLVGGIPTNSNFKVGDFNNGQPKISFSSFQGMAESIFSAIPYRFYYDSSWKGSWLGALQSGACNCYDGASALIAFANACGFGGYMAHGTWTDADGSSYGHVWAVIDGKKMDTTGWQQRGTWTPSASAGGRGRSSRYYGGSDSGTTINIHIDMSGSNNYGIDSIEDVVEEGVNKGLREHFNNPNTVLI